MTGNPLLDLAIFGGVFLLQSFGMALFLWQRSKAIMARALADKDLALANEIKTAGERAAVAEQRVLRVPELERALLISESKARDLSQTTVKLEARTAELEAQLMYERKSHAEKINLLDRARSELAESFRTLSADALRQNSQAFVQMATAAFEKQQFTVRADFEGGNRMVGDALKPVTETIEKLHLRLGELEQARHGAYEGLNTQVRELLETQQGLRFETSNLTKALGTPGQRGRWGEIQLRRVAELAGMVAHCDFYEPATPTLAGEPGATRLRPDVLVRLPGGRTIVIDAHAPTADFLEALGALTHEDRVAKLQGHAIGLRNHVKALASKSYWEQFQPSPEFVVLFLPGEAFFSAALDTDPTLIEFGVEKRVLIATPTTLIAMLRAVHYGWKQETQFNTVREVSALGATLHQRLAVLGDRLAHLGAGIADLVERYNEGVSTLVTQVLPATRELRDRLPPDSGNEIPPPPFVDKSARLPLPQELRPQVASSQPASLEPPPLRSRPPAPRSRLPPPPPGVGNLSTGLPPAADL